MKKNLKQISQQNDTNIDNINHRDTRIIFRTLVNPVCPTLSKAEQRAIEQTLINGETKK